MATLHVSSCIICDDVRTEIGGKEILIGVYPVGISVPRLPWHAFGALRLTVIWSGDGDVDFKIRVLNPAQTEVASASGTGTAIWQGFQSSITLPTFLLSFDMEGVYDIQMSKQDGPWENIHRFPVYIART
jgi:hypothetical protein